MGRKIVTFDLETTGLKRESDQIIQFAGLKIDKDSNQVIDELYLFIQPTGYFEIHPGAYIKHGISAKSLEDKPHFADVAKQIEDFFETPDTVDILTYNGTSFDIPFLVSEFKRAGLDFSFLGYACYDAFLEEKHRNGLNLEKVYARYKGTTMEEAGLKAHDASSDVKATYTVYYAQMKIKEYAPTVMFGNDNVISVMEFKGEDIPCFNIGKYRALSIDFVKGYDPGYLEWGVSDKCNWSDATKKYIRDNYLKKNLSESEV